MQFILILVGLFAAGTEVTNAEPAQPPASPMVCETGPVQKIFGGTSWNVLSCDDSVSMIVVSAKGNPASPFYFVLKPDPSRIEDRTLTSISEGVWRFAKSVAPESVREQNFD